MPVIGESIKFGSQMPNFDRDKVKTIQELKNINIYKYDYGHIVFCEEDGLHYIFRYPEKQPDEITGYFEVFVEPLSDTEIDDIFKQI